MTLRDIYVSAIREIMAQHEIEAAPAQPQYEVGTGASFTDAVQYTDWYLTTHGNDVEHYRFDRYFNAIDQVFGNYAGRLIHIDIGCGAGPFSWAFMDWATKRGMASADLSLYGYDPSQEMIRLAWMLRAKMRSADPSYPDLQYDSNYASFIRRLANIRGHADCLITFGHVLAGNHDHDDIGSFTRIIDRVTRLTDHLDQVWLLASDATSDRHRDSFESGWSTLLLALQEIGVQRRSVPVFTGRSSDRCVILSRKEV